MNIEVIRYRLPVYWACALINGDYTGLSDEEEREINNFLEQAEGYPVDVDKVRMKGMNQGIWLAVQELAHDGRWTQAAEELVSSCGLTEDECRKLQEESGSFNDEMLEFIDMVFGHTDMIGEGEDDTE